MTDVSQLCACGCGEVAPDGCRFVQYHHLHSSNPDRGASRGSDHYAWRRELHEEERGYTTGCLIPDLKARGDGYVRVMGGAHKASYLHRLRWEEVHGPIPSDREIDHLCYQRDCQNVEHMELVTRTENCRRRRVSRNHGGPILVTGANGFIGKALVVELKGAGHRVIGVDLEDGDLSEKGEAFRLVRLHEPSKVVHLAARVGRRFCEDDPGAAITANGLATGLLARAAAWIGAEFVYCSTSEVYGDHGDEMVHEFVPLTAPPSGIYALTKRFGEQMAQLYAPKGLKILRPSMPYGVGAPPGRGRRALDTFLWQAHHRMPITVHMGASRSWCWLGDVVRGMRLVIESDQTGPFNIGRDDAEITMLALADWAVDLTSAARDLISMVPAPTGQTVVKRLSTDRLRSLGWQPRLDLAEGLPLVLEWVRHFDAEGHFHDDVLADDVELGARPVGVAFTHP